jgi:putative salt-induced outer membrane protein YdiY
MKERLIFTSSLVLMTTSVPATAQVNVETLRGDLRQKPAIAQLEGAFTGRLGNVEGVVAGGAANGAARAGDHRFYMSTAGDYTRFAHVTRVSKSFVHLRYNYVLAHDWLLGELFAQQQHDKFQRLLLRELFGIGPRFVLAEEEDVRIAYGTSWMLEYERIAVAQGAPDNPEIVAQRWNNYLSAMVRPDDRVRAVATIYVQPRFDAFTDVRVLLETAVQTDVTKVFGLKVLATVRHDTQPPTEVKRTDLEVKNAIVVKF